MVQCCVKECKSNSRKKNPKISFHRLPRNPKTRAKWIEKIGRPDWYPKRNTYICSLHFEEGCINNTLNVTRVKDDSIPTIFPERVEQHRKKRNVLKGSSVKPVCKLHQDANILKKYHMDHSYSKVNLDYTRQNYAEPGSVEDDLELGDKADNISDSEDNPLLGSPATTQKQIIPEQAHSQGKKNEAVPEKAYSWEKKNDAVPIQADIAGDDEDNLSMYCDNGASPPYPELQDDPTLHHGYHCNVCDGEIRGFRYTCVQCSDFDLCSTCEMNGAHPHHYVLRVPEPRPYVEIHSVLSRIRRHLMQKMDPIGDDNQDLDDTFSVKSEVKSEDEDEEAMGVTADIVDDEMQELTAHSENVTDETDIDSSETFKHNVVKIVEVPTPSESKDVSKEKQRTPIVAPEKLLVKLNEFMNMPQAKRICLMRISRTQSATRQDSCQTNQNKPQCLDSQSHSPELTDPLHIAENGGQTTTSIGSTKLSLSVYKRRISLDDR